MVAASLLGLLASSVAAGAAGVEQSPVPRDAGEVPGPGLDDISRELATAAQRLAGLDDATRLAENDLATAEAAATAAVRDHDDRVTDLGTAEALIVAAEVDLRDLLGEATQTRHRLSRLRRERYATGDVSSLSILVAADSFAEYTDGQLLSRIAQRHQTETLRTSADQEATIRSEVRQLQEQRDRLDTLAAQAATDMVTARSAELTALIARQELQALVVRERDAVAALESARADEERRLAELSASSSALARRLVDHADTQSTVPAGDRVGMSTPVQGYISSPFGMRMHPILNYERLHTGIDFAAACGAPVYAAADGTVVSAEWSGGYGNQLAVDHGRLGGLSVATTYNHLTSFVITAGPVGRGDLIAYVGTTGMSTGCHLHFETREQGQPVDPMGWLT